MDVLATKVARAAQEHNVRQVLVAGKNVNYTPTVGDRVHCSVIDDQLFIDYKIG